MVQPSKARGEPPVAAQTGRLRPSGVAVLGWLVPGAAHIAMGDARRGAVFLTVLLFMFVMGLAFGGRVFPFQMSDPLMLLAALSEWALGAPRVIAGVAGWGRGDVVAATYEYGNTFLIAGGLLNLLVILDAVDRVRGQKGR